MIKNIVFDLGRVLLEWEPYQYMLENFPKHVADEMNEKIFESRDFWLMDKGLMNEDQLWQRKMEELPHLKEYILHMKEAVPKLLRPIEKNTRLLPKLKEKGFRLYVLSNFSEKNFELVHKKFDFFKYFDGMVISSHVKLAKPEKEIFLELIKRYNLVPQESIFIDDKLENVKTAQELNFKVIHLTNGTDLEEELWGILRECDGSERIVRQG
ncbi:haloacid dehalogenase [Pseudothermotoga hypogea DSM 11164 = NBRC 106472]|uniref:Haloacid dehalogenase n=1 Tax=Pseudothermotoga hypogea DSM 11164 = NBRC 106472 TaxID=1123384 RepID=A0A0X1KQM7_9THEM|nr:HAD family phosphatase [Pseudothermotoga hypogea]AJC73553.1 haloacid dehalogenase [Pseudothermotoga hypogea DSM 11164 = NBRC 106472]